MAERRDNKDAGKGAWARGRRFSESANTTVRFYCEEDGPSTYDREDEEDGPSTYDHEDEDDDMMMEVVVSGDGQEGSSSSAKPGQQQEQQEEKQEEQQGEQQPDSEKKRGLVRFWNRTNAIIRNIMTRTAHSSWRKPQ